MGSKLQRSAGAIALARLGKTQEDIAAKCKVTRQLVSLWLRGERKPNATTRATLFKLFGIPVASWDEAPLRASKAPKTAEPATPPPDDSEAPRNDAATPLTAKRNRLERLLEADMAKLEADTEMTPLERAKVMASMGATIGLLGKLTGETQEIGESRILRLPAWRRIEAAIVAALTPWPDAMRAVGETLKGMGE